MKSIFGLAVALSGNFAFASKLYAASYGGSVYSLELTRANGSYELSTIDKSQDCGISPSWLMLDQPHGILYCLNEAIGATNGSITSFKAHEDGSLSTIERLTTPGGLVMSAMFSAPGVKDSEFFAVAHYETSTVTNYAVDRVKGEFHNLQTFHFEMSHPGPNTTRQDAPHPHGVFIDPSRRFVLVPDLGADLIRIFSIHSSNGTLKPMEPYHATPGSGPRHITFWAPKGTRSTTDNVYMFLVHELTNMVSGFRVNYREHVISFEKIFEGTSFGNQTAPSSSKVAEIKVSPENNHIVVSNRLDNTFGRNNDSIAIFKIADASGEYFTGVHFVGLYPAFGSSVRQFDIGGSPDRLGLALEVSQKVGVAQWDTHAGVPGNLLAEKTLDGDVPAVVWAD
ncbi:Cytochrome cd1-nitrite reductase-like C-terminal heme d1 [Penicillium odoratum]|uniref:Cytochrome cd1-nitrite reductase-like C-terminal heme d1 n=1 Tax=Penicillium odoratum TaxID=1167516 RepID=UPI0025466CC6|nr:Cytochrome cd1-nitrite reductase-like C-terminal heme d1 [Penicillium odoratum]KAJ5752190.1 Cytochrome cd1-nitrite reductase-like C-terminal heme d1 [Penicillium odoratum]